MLKRCLCIALALLSAFALSARAAGEELLPSGISRDKIGEAIEAFVKDPVCGVMSAVFDANGTICEGYFGCADKEKGLLAGRDTVMEWGSITKLTVWVSVMQLWEKGLIELDRDVREYLPEGFLKKPVTMLDLMCHTAGFEEVWIGMEADSPENVVPLEQALRDCAPNQYFEPGTVTAYSNYGAALAGFIVERISGQSFAEYVREHIFEPLGMAHVAILPDLSDNEWVNDQRDLLRCFDEQGNVKKSDRMYLDLYPAGMCVSTLEDLVRFGRGLLDENHPLFENAETVRELFSPTSFYGDTDIVMNMHGFWSYDGIPQTAGHNGGTYGCTSFLYFDLKTGVGMAIMTNQRSEQLYTVELPRLLFGKGPGSDIKARGCVEAARGVFTGPLRLGRLFNIMPLNSVAGTALTVENDSFGIHRYSVGSMDLLPVGTGELMLLYGSVALWAAAALFSLILLIVALVRLALKKSRVLGGWGVLSCLLMPLPLIVIAVIAVSLLGFRVMPAAVYKLLCAFILILCAAMAALAVAGVARRKRPPAAALRILIVISLLISVANIIFWQVYQFWAI